MTYDTTVPFGRHAGRLVSTLARSHPRYLIWLCTVPNAQANPALWRALQAHVPTAMQCIADEVAAQRAETKAVVERMQALRARRQAELDTSDLV